MNYVSGHEYDDFSIIIIENIRCATMFARKRQRTAFMNVHCASSAMTKKKRQQMRQHMA